MSPATPPTAATPPTVPGERPAPQVVWPKGLGIVAIVFGSFGVLAGLGGAVGAVATPIAMTAAKQQINEAQTGLVILSRITGLFVGLAAILLIVGGAWLLGRNPRARPIILIWSVLKFVLVVASQLLAYFTSSHSAAASTSKAGANVTMFFSGLGAIGACFGIAWGCALPVFMLVWFNRPTVRAEIEKWKGEGSVH